MSAHEGWEEVDFETASDAMGEMQIECRLDLGDVVVVCGLHPKRGKVSVLHSASGRAAMSS
jgi:hypothetical protein